MRVFDENVMMPSVLPGKTLHHRTKSVPAFSTVQPGAAKGIAAAAVATAAVASAAANKKVLGEVNTNLKMAPSASDDSVIGKKAITVDIVKPLARPAARPSTAKSFSTLSVPGVVAGKESASLPMVPLQEPARKLVVKKSTKVLKDAEVVEATVPVGQPAITEDAHANELSLEAAPVSAPVQSVVVESSHSQDLPSHNNIQVAIVPPQSTTSSHIPTDFKSDRDYITDLESQATRLVERLTKVEAEHFTAPQVADHATEQQVVAVMPSTTTTAVAATQYYDDIEHFDDDAYTTACSFSLRGGSVTAMIIQMPKQTEESRYEIKAAKMLTEDNRTLDDIEDEAWDTSMVAEYSEEIFEYMRTLEERMVPDPRYMDTQTEIQWSMRSVLVDWVVQVHQRFNLLPETLFLAVNYIDRFLSKKVVSLNKLQLVGATAIFIAAKFEEINCPTLTELIFMVDGGYTMDELLKAERFMLSMLKFDLGWPGPMSFLRRISKADDYDLETRTLAKYFLEVTLMDERFVGCTPSFLAAGAHCVARLMLCKGEWTEAHVAYAEYTFDQLRHLLAVIIECCENPRKHHLSIYEKYTDRRYKRASIFVEGEMRKGLTFQSLIHFNNMANAMPTVI